ncbi:hypothetical protein B0J12DRAFT_283192 [Macrophomina phaseolina]|uniref:Uncharacterized protein n=1 Tax=Macrophomina phaseolina TaxID=35725 RepID=A0ABQ8GN28_9PEZI|nr:hypothetical protein B0J12DRAFT_283192 [Macrophomina phaseolina]
MFTLLTLTTLLATTALGSPIAPAAAAAAAATPTGGPQHPRRGHPDPGLQHHHDNHSVLRRPPLHAHRLRLLQQHDALPDPKRHRAASLRPAVLRRQDLRLQRRQPAVEQWDRRRRWRLAAGGRDAHGHASRGCRMEGHAVSRLRDALIRW